MARLGGVGTFAVQLAKAFGAEVTAVCSTSKIRQILILEAGKKRIVPQQSLLKLEDLFRLEELRDTQSPRANGKRGGSADRLAHDRACRHHPGAGERHVGRTHVAAGKEQIVYIS